MQTSSQSGPAANLTPPDPRWLAQRAGDDVPGGLAAQGRGNVLKLALAQALAGANSTVIYATGAIVGDALAPSRALATLPITVFVVGMAASTLPAGMIARRHGRRTAFLCGTGGGVLAGLLAAAAVMVGSFWLFCVATLLGGAYAAVVLTFRFAAADCVPAGQRARALSAVMAGGIASGVIGPELVTYTMTLLPAALFAATYLAQAAVAALSAAILSGVRLPRPAAGETEAPGGRPLGVIARQPRFIAAVVGGAVAYLIMNFLMTAAPLAMHICGLSQGTADRGIEWHVIAMYAPSFFTGRLITRLGAGRVVSGGLLLLAAAAIVGLLGVDVVHFWLSLILLGMGWNFGFLGASSLVLECHRPEENTRVQSFNDFMVFGTMVIGSFLSGSLLTAYGWSMVLALSFVPLALAVTVLAATARSRQLRAVA